MEVLKKLSHRWFQIGTYLDVSVDSLNSFRSKSEYVHIPDGDCLISMINCWINEGEDVSWEKLAQALDKCGLADTATVVRERYMLQVAASIADVNEIVIQPDSSVIETLQGLEVSFCRLLVKLEELQGHYHIHRGVLFLNVLIGRNEFEYCKLGKQVLQKLSDNYMDTFNIEILRKYVTAYNNEEMVKITEEYQEEKKRFLASAPVRDFQQAVVSKVESQSSGDVVVEIMMPNKYQVTKRTLDDIVKLAFLGLEGSQHKSQVRVQASAL